MTNKQDELLPCPFCGGEAEIVKNSFPPGNPWFHPSCKKFDCPGNVIEQDEQGGTVIDCYTAAQAIAIWNTRPTPSDEVKRLEEDARRYRFLKKHNGMDDDFQVEVYVQGEHHALGHLDAQIDAALSHKEEAE